MRKVGGRHVRVHVYALFAQGGNMTTAMKDHQVYQIICLKMQSNVFRGLNIEKEKLSRLIFKLFSHQSHRVIML